MTLRKCGIVGSVLVALVTALRVTSGAPSDNPSQPEAKNESPAPPATEPSTSPAEAEYHESVHTARVTYCQALVAADQKLLQRIDGERKAAKQAGNEAEVERLDRRSESAAARLREDQAMLAAARAREPARVVSAQFGQGRNWADVTERVKELTASTHVFRSNADTLGIDPSPGWRKKLEIVYIQDGERRTAMIDTDGEIRVPGLIPAEPESQ